VIVKKFTLLKATSFERREGLKEQFALRDNVVSAVDF